MEANLSENSLSHCASSSKKAAYFALKIIPSATFSKQQLVTVEQAYKALTEMFRVADHARQVSHFSVKAASKLKIFIRL